MNEKIVTSQAELDAIPVDYNGRIIIKFGTPGKRAVVSKKYLCPVEVHGNSYVTKATCLWLVNLPKLKGNGLPKPDNGKLFGKLPSGKNRTWEDAYSRSAKVRSKTFPGIATAMAEQWGGGARTHG